MDYKKRVKELRAVSTPLATTTLPSHLAQPSSFRAIYDQTARLTAAFESVRSCEGERARSRATMYVKAHLATLVQLYADEFALGFQQAKTIAYTTGLIEDPDALISMMEDYSLTEEIFDV